MNIAVEVENWYGGAKDFISDLRNRPVMAKIPVSEESGGGWINYVGLVPKHFLDHGPLWIGLNKLMSQAGITMGWRPNGSVHPETVRLVETVVGRNAEEEDLVPPKGSRKLRKNHRN